MKLYHNLSFVHGEETWVVLQGKRTFLPDLMCENMCEFLPFKIFLL